MLETIAAAQTPLLVLLLTLGAVAKAATAHLDLEPGGLVRLGPAALVPPRRRRPVMYACAGGELLLAAGLTFGTGPLFRWGAVGFFAMSTYVLLEVRRRRPDVGCGCFGEVSARPIGWRTIGRAVVLGAMSAGTVWAPVPALNVVSGLSWTTVAAMAGGLAVLAALSPELEETVARLRHRAPCEQRALPESAALSRLLASAAWRAHAPFVTGDRPVDSWRELCWRFFVYPGRGPGGEEVDVVFAVYLSGRRPPVRAALVDADGAAVVAAPSAAPVPVTSG